MSHLVPFSTILFEGWWLVCISSKLQLTWRGSGFGVSTSTTRHFARGVATSCRKPLNTIHNWKVLDQEGSKEKAPLLVMGEWDKRCNNAQHLELILVHRFCSLLATQRIRPICLSIIIDVANLNVQTIWRTLPTWKICRPLFLIDLANRSFRLSLEGPRAVRGRSSPAVMPRCAGSEVKCFTPRMWLCNHTFTCRLIIISFPCMELWIVWTLNPKSKRSKGLEPVFCLCFFWILVENKFEI